MEAVRLLLAAGGLRVAEGWVRVVDTTGVALLEVREVLEKLGFDLGD